MMLRQPALGAIWAYQRIVSPRKGFGCAYRLAHGGTGCSGYAKRAIADHGVFSALPLIRRRFAACKQAARALADQRKDTEKAKRKKSRWYDYGDCLLGCSPCGGGGGSKVKPVDSGSDCTPDCTPDCCSW